MNPRVPQLLRERVVGLDGFAEFLEGRIADAVHLARHAMTGVSLAGLLGPGGSQSGHYILQLHKLTLLLGAIIDAPTLLATLYFAGIEKLELEQNEVDGLQAGADAVWFRRFVKSAFKGGFVKRSRTVLYVARLRL